MRSAHSYRARVFTPAFVVSCFAVCLLAGEVTVRAQPVAAKAPPAAAVAPASVGFSAERLARLRAGMQGYVDQGKVAGLVVYVARNGKVAFHEAFGQADREAKVAMKRDSIFRIASQTKALTSVAIMMLVEEGKLGLADPVSKYLPAFKNWYFADRKEPVAAVIEKLAALPMNAQPGEAFVYGYGSDILGVVVEKVTGQTLAEVFQQRITGPLGMVDTQFYLPPAQKARLAAVYALKPDGKIERAGNTSYGQGHYVEGPRVALSGGAGLLSTARYYGRFLQNVAQRRAARRRAAAEPQDGRADDDEPRGLADLRGLADRSGAGLWPRLRDHRGHRQDGAVRHRRHLRLVRRLSHDVLGGSEGEARGGDADAALAFGRLRPAGPLPHAGLSGAHPVSGQRRRSSPSLEVAVTVSSPSQRRS